MNNIKKYRELTKLNQKQFAARCGWIPTRLSNYENYHRTPSLVDVNTILDQFNNLGISCSFSDIFPSEIPPSIEFEKKSA